VIDRSYGHDERADQPIGHCQRCHEVIRHRPQSPGREHGEYDQRVAHLETTEKMMNSMRPTYAVFFFFGFGFNLLDR
jgi:hypothetical protein